MAEDQKLVSLSGAPIWKHQERTKPFEMVAGDEESIKEISEHIEKHVGPIHMVWHELVSDLVHIDLHHVAPTKERDFHVLVTSGMSDRPMNTPKGAEDCQYAELLIVLPDHWPVDEDAFQDEANYWPIRMVKQLARMPHEYDTWLWWAHTVDNADPAETFHPSTKLLATILVPPILLPQDFGFLETCSGQGIAFFAAVPLYKEEVRYKMNNGAEALLDRFDEHGITELIDPHRTNTCSRWWTRFCVR